MLGHRTLNAEDYFGILKRRWWVLLIPAAVLPVLAVIASYFVTPKYDSTSLLLIEQQKVSSDVVKPLDIGGLQSRLDLITARIESTSTLQPIIEKYNLYANQHLPMEARVALMRKNLTFPPIEGQIQRGNGLPGFSVVFTADDPHTAQQVCADITGLFTQQNLLQRQAVTAGTTQFLQSQFDEETRKLNDMDQKLAAFKAQHMGSLPGDENSTASVLGSLGSRLDANRQAIQNLQQRKEMMNLQLQELKRAEAPVGGVSAKTVSADQDQLDKLETQLTDLKLKYSEDYPDVKTTERLITEQKAKIAKAAAAPAAPTPAAAPHVDSPQVEQLQTAIRLIDQTIAQSEKDQQAINAQMGAAQGRLQSSPAVEQEYQELTRNYATETQIYNNLLAKLNGAQESTALENRQEGENFSVLDMASLPVEPTSPKQSVFAAGGVGAGLALGVLIIAFLEYRDTALSTERDVWAFTQLPTLAVIAYSDDVAEGRSSNAHVFKRWFGRKAPKELVAG